MVDRLVESSQYRHNWSTPAVDRILADDARLAAWLTIVAALAQAQADSDIIPRDAAQAISHLTVSDCDQEAIARGTRETGHSTLGFIRELQRVLPEHAKEHVCFGVTVQDITDTWFGLVMRDVGRDLIERCDEAMYRALRLAETHRSTAMIGRTHGQVGAPITFGLKAASWADEIDRASARLRDGAQRWSVVQLAGAVGAFGFLDGEGANVRSRFAQILGLVDPLMSWTTSRDRVAEFGFCATTLTTTCARIGNEIYELQRTEIGEVREAATRGVVGSITMPHKRNPERSEQVDTLARVAQAASGVLQSAMVSSHERDGRSWKAEWWALPEVVLASMTAVEVVVEVLDGLEVDTDRMMQNMRAGGAYLSQQVLAQLSKTMGKHRAQNLLQASLADRSGNEDEEATMLLMASGAGVAVEDMRAWAQWPDVLEAEIMVDATIARLGRNAQSSP